MVHTADPLTGDAGTTVGELVVGMGEALVGNLPGRALSFSAAAGAGAGEAHSAHTVLRPRPSAVRGDLLSARTTCASPLPDMDARLCRQWVPVLLCTCMCRSSWSGLRAPNPRCGAGGVEVAGLPSKRLGLFASPGGALIVRSDSNGEDLESFAGAGMFRVQLKLLQSANAAGLAMVQQPN